MYQNWGNTSNDISEDAQKKMNLSNLLWILIWQIHLIQPAPHNSYVRHKEGAGSNDELICTKIVYNYKRRDREKET